MMQRHQYSRLDQANIPDVWPGKALRATINESRPNFRGKRILITGACGFIGGHLARALEAAGAIVIALDVDISPIRDSQLDLAGLRKRIEIFEGDVTRRIQMEELVLEGDFSYIFHLAPSVEGFENLIAGARLLPSRQRPVIIYGCTNKLGDEVETNLDEIEVPTLTLRLCNIFGPYDLNFKSHLVPKAMYDIFANGESPTLYMNSIENFGDYLFVEDAVRAFLCAACSANCYGGTYDLSGTHYSSTPDVLREIVTFIGDKQDKESITNPESALSKLRWNRSICVASSETESLTICNAPSRSSLLERATGFSPITTFHAGLAATANFYLWYLRDNNKPDTLPIETKKEVIASGSYAILNSLHASEESAFETIFTEDGLPVQRLKPKSSTRIIEEKPIVLKPTSFITEAYLAT
jgi:nucleoside-diphosphate-sugar epimerase